MFDNFCWTCEGNEPVTSKFCCPGENQVSNGDFEGPTGNFTSAYQYQTSIAPNSVAPGMCMIMNQAQAMTISNQWIVQDHSCTPTGYFYVVNGTTSQSGPKLAWEQTVTVQPNTEYRFCAFLKDLPQCAFNVNPRVKIHFNAPTGSIAIINTTVNAPAGLCNWQQVSQAIQTGPASGAYPLQIQIWIDETPAGDGNDLAIDDIALIMMPPLNIGYSQFLVASSGINPSTYNITATPAQALPATGKCAYYWEVCEVDNLNACISTTTLPNPSQWWTGATTFPGYNGTSTLPSGTTTTSPPGVFQIGKRYKIRYGVWCECNSWSQSVLIIEYNQRMQRLETKSWVENLSNIQTNR